MTAPLEQAPEDTQHFEAQREFLRQLGIEVPIPPKDLQKRSAGAYYPEFFLHGHHLLDHMAKILKSNGAGYADFERILDFGCGCGRVTIPLQARVDPQRIYGVDVDEEAINWCRNSLSQFGGFALNPHLPPSSFPDNHFDFVYGISVFTHLPEEYQFKWLAELQRISRPGGLLILSTHGEATWKNLNENGKKRLRESGFFYVPGRESTFSGLPAYYQTTWHTAEYINREWTDYFEVLAQVPQGIGGLHDAILLQKR